MVVFTNFNVGILSEKTLIRDLAHVILAHDHVARYAAGRLFRYEGGVYSAAGELYVKRQVKQLIVKFGWPLEGPAGGMMRISPDKDQSTLKPRVLESHCGTSLLVLPPFRKNSGVENRDLTNGVAACWAFISGSLPLALGGLEECFVHRTAVGPLPTSSKLRMRGPHANPGAYAGGEMAGS